MFHILLYRKISVVSKKKLNGNFRLSLLLQNSVFRWVCILDYRFRYLKKRYARFLPTAREITVYNDFWLRCLVYISKMHCFFAFFVPVFRKKRYSVIVFDGSYTFRFLLEPTPHFAKNGSITFLCSPNDHLSRILHNMLSVIRNKS